MGLVRKLAAGLGAVASVALFLRAGLGPFHIGPVVYSSPLTVESIFAAVFPIGVFLATDRNSTAIDPDPERFSLPLLFLALALVALAYARNVPSAFLSDDYIMLDRLFLDWPHLLATFHTPGGDGSFRPIGYSYFGLLRYTLHFDPVKWHLVSLALHLLNCTLLFATVWTVWKNNLSATVAALLFGLHGTTPETVAWTSCNFDLLACFFTLAATLIVMRSEGPSVGTGSLALVLLAIAVGSKEAAYAAPVVIGGFVLAADRLRNRRMQIFLVAVAFEFAALLAYRFYLFHGPGGYTDHLHQRAQILEVSFILVAKALLLRIWAILLVPVNWDASGPSWWLALGLLINCATIVYALYISPKLRWREPVGMLGMTLLACVPPIHLALIGANALGSRILYIPSIGICVLLARYAATAPTRNLRLVCAVCLSTSAGILLLHNLAAWRNAAELADRTCTEYAGHPEAPLPPQPSTLNGVVYFANGLQECVDLKRRAMAGSAGSH